jgi:hypothetical protein
MRWGGWYAYDERCPEWPYCTGHMGPTPEQHEAERVAAAKRVAVKRAVRMLLRAIRASA